VLDRLIYIFPSVSIGLYNKVVVLGQGNNHLPSHVGYLESHSTVIIGLMGVVISSVLLLVISAVEIGYGVVK
jgi:hypothetical protein